MSDKLKAAIVFLIIIACLYDPAFGSDSAYYKDVDKRVKTAYKGYTDSQMVLLARIIHHEAQGEPMNGKLAVGTVIMNRSKTPERIASVVYAPNQFSGVSRGYIKRVKPNKESMEAARMVLEGYRSFGEGVKWYCNEKTAQTHWMREKLKLVKNIGSHSFYEERK